LAKPEHLWEQLLESRVIAARIHGERNRKSRIVRGEGTGAEIRRILRAAYGSSPNMKEDRRDRRLLESEAQDPHPDRADGF
jgi:hypothetical protein